MVMWGTATLRMGGYMLPSVCLIVTSLRPQRRWGYALYRVPFHCIYLHLQYKRTLWPAGQWAASHTSNDEASR